MKDQIKLGEIFYIENVRYKCVGHDDGLIWGCTDDYSESKPFDFYQCLVVSMFNVSDNVILSTPILTP